MTHLAEDVQDLFPKSNHLVHLADVDDCTVHLANLSDALDFLHGAFECLAIDVDHEDGQTFLGILDRTGESDTGPEERFSE